MCHKLFMVCSILGCVLFIPGGALFIPRGCLIHPHPALIIPRVGLNWSPGMNRSLYLTLPLQKHTGVCRYVNEECSAGKSQKKNRNVASMGRNLLDLT